MMVLTQQVLNEKLKEVNKVFASLTARVEKLEEEAKRTAPAKKPVSK